MQSGDNELRQKSGWISTPEFDELYDEYKAAVFGFAFYLTHNHGEAEDLFQEAWLRIVRKMPEKVNRESMKAWIFTIVANLQKDMLRKKRVRRLFFQKSKHSDENDVFFPDKSEMSLSNSADDMDYVDMGKDINQAIASLPDRQRRVFVLKEIAGFRQAEVGDILGIPVGTVKSLMFRAVKRLQRELSAYEPRGERIKCDAKTLSV